MWYEVTIDVRWSFAFVFASCAIALALGRIIRRVQGPREDDDMLGSSDSQRMAALDVEEHCAVAERKGRMGVP